VTTRTLESCRVGVVVPNWNGAAFIGATLDALSAQSRRPDEVIVVDNGSTDGSAAILADRHPWVRVLPLPRNVGFGGAANAGLRASSADLVVVLNSDARPRHDWLETLLDQPDDLQVWAWGSVLVTPAGAVESAGDHYDPAGYAYKMAAGVELTELPTAPYDVFAPPGACPLLRREVVLGLGGYADRFFLYYEDVDLAYRALLAGYRAVVVPGAVVEHDLARSSGGSSRPWFYIGRNSLWCAVRCQPVLQAGSLWRRTRREWRTARERGGGRVYLLGRFVGLAGLPWALVTRRRIQGGRAVEPAAVAHVLSNPPLPRRGVAA
jgi:GT2 family glycosyltransferase